MKNFFKLILDLAEKKFYGITTIKWQAGQIAHVDNQKSEDTDPFKYSREEITELKERLK
jgi:hypothetical protein